MLLALLTMPALLSVSCGTPSYATSIGPQDIEGNYTGRVYETVRCALSGRGGGTRYYQRCAIVKFDANGLPFEVTEVFYASGTKSTPASQCLE